MLKLEDLIEALKDTPYDCVKTDIHNPKIFYDCVKTDIHNPKIFDLNLKEITKLREFKKEEVYLLILKNKTIKNLPQIEIRTRSLDPDFLLKPKENLDEGIITKDYLSLVIRDGQKPFHRVRLSDILKDPIHLRSIEQICYKVSNTIPYNPTIEIYPDNKNNGLVNEIGLHRNINMNLLSSKENIKYIKEGILTLMTAYNFISTHLNRLSEIDLYRTNILNNL